jgi:hypothetical protein
VAKGSGDAYWETGRKERGDRKSPYSLIGNRKKESEDYRRRKRPSAPPPQGRRPGEILQGRGAKALEESVPEVAPASS